MAGRRPRCSTSESHPARSRPPVDAGRPAENGLADEILKSLRRILRRTAEYSRHLSQEAGLSIPQMLCLRSIGSAAAAQEMTVARIAEAVQLSSATVSRILDRLEADGLVVRQRSPADRRRVCLSLTPAGRRRLKKLPAPLQENFLARLQRLELDEQRELLESLRSIVQMMDAADLEAAPMLTPGADVKTPSR